MPSNLVGQHDSVGVLLITLVLVRQNFFKPLCLPFCNPHIYRLRVVAYEELLAATVTPERSHLLEAYCFFAATLSYRFRPHVLILAERQAMADAQDSADFVAGQTGGFLDSEKK